MSSTEQETLEQRAAELRAVVNTPTERDLAARELIEVETQLAERRKAEALDAAKARLIAIKRAHPSLLQTYVEDQERAVRALADLSAAIATMNQRYEKLTELALEARDIGKDTGLPVPDFASLKAVGVVTPADLLRDATPDVRPLDVTDAQRMRRQHDAKREGPAATRYDFRE